MFQRTFDPTRYPKAWLALGHNEASVQKMVLQGLLGRGILAYPTDAGGKTLRGRAYGALKAAGAPLHLHRYVNQGQAMGLAGLSDITGVLPGGRALYIEVKAPAWLMISPVSGKLIQRRAAGKLEPDQIVFLTKAEEQGALVGVAWGPQDLWRILVDAACAPL